MALSYASLRKTDPSTPCSVPHSLSRALGVEEVLEAGPLSGQSHCWVVTSSLGYLGTLATALMLLEPRRDEDKEGQGLASLQLVTEASTLLFQKPEKPRNSRPQTLTSPLGPPSSYQRFGTAIICLLISVGEIPQEGTERGHSGLS